MSTMMTGNYQYSTTNPLANMTFLTAAKAAMHKKEFITIAGNRSTDMRTEKTMAWEGFGSAPEKSEGSAPESKKITESYANSITQKTYGLELPLTIEQQRFSVKNAQFVKNIADMRSKSIALSYEYNTAAKYSNGFATETTGDGLYAFSASHLWKSDLSTFSNLLTTSVPEKTAIQDALIQISQQEMEADVVIDVMPKEIRYGTDHIMLIKEVLKSIKDPDTANNTYNPVVDWNLKPNLNHYFNTNDWFVSGAENSDDEFIELLQSMAPNFYEDKQASGARNIIMGALCMFGVGYKHSKGIKLYGNAGA